jgi:hypothetical protein
VVTTISGASGWFSQATADWLSRAGNAGRSQSATAKLNQDFMGLSTAAAGIFASASQTLISGLNDLAAQAAVNRIRGQIAHKLDIKL